MKFKVYKSDIKGEVDIPPSKSHTIRAFFFATLAEGRSKIIKPLISDDALSALNACKLFGAQVEQYEDYFQITGINGNPVVPEDVINVGNSGTTLRIATGTASLIEGYTVFTGDHQIRNRTLLPLIEALNNLGATIISTKNNGKAPVIVKGKAKGGYTTLDAVSSQFLTSLLINCPLMEKDTEIELIRLYEKPYVEMTLWWLDRFGIKYENENFERFKVYSNQKYKPFEITVPADFSSATFFLVLAAISGGEIKLNNLDMSDPQGDKMVVKILEEMGAKVKIENNSIIIKGEKLKGIEIDMNSIPDALPALAVAGCFATGETRLLNVPQARLKETDRIKVMYEELKKMGADIKELEDGLIIKESKLKSTKVNGHHDHRVVMALSIAGLVLDGITEVDTAEAASVTFPTFVETVKRCNGNILVE